MPVFGQVLQKSYKIYIYVFATKIRKNGRNTKRKPTFLLYVYQNGRWKTLEASSLDNRGYEHSEHPRTPGDGRSIPYRTLEGCPSISTRSDISLIILHTHFIEQQVLKLYTLDSSVMHNVPE